MYGSRFVRLAITLYCSMACFLTREYDRAVSGRVWHLYIWFIPQAYNPNLTFSCNGRFGFPRINPNNSP